jgi:hypothetical protein
MSGTPVELSWYGCDLRTGGIIEDLRSLKPSGPLSRKLGDSTTLQLDLTLPGAPPGWDAATTPGSTMLVAVDTATDIPVWAGAMLTREGGSAQTVSLGAATLERYLDSRYPGDVNLFGFDQASVVTTLITPALTEGPPLILDAPTIGVTMDYQVADSDDRSILSCLQEVMGLEGGPEWTIDVAWNASHSGFVLPVRVRAAIGAQSSQPEGTFDFPGCVTTYTLGESYESGKGANAVVARGEGEGASRLTSLPQTADYLLNANWPKWEYRFTPASGVTDPDQLTAHAVQSLALMAEGAQAWTIQAVASQAPRLGRDWALGDTIRITVQTSPRHPAGIDTVARCWSWELDPDANTVTPILVEDS